MNLPEIPMSELFPAKAPEPIPWQKHQHRCDACRDLFDCAVLCSLTRAKTATDRIHGMATGILCFMCM